MKNFPTVLILAGGLGTRINSINPELPKAMLPIGNKPFIAHQLALLARESVKQVIVCVGYRSQPLIDYIGSGEAFGLEVQYCNDGEKLLGTGGAVCKAIQAYKVKQQFAVLYGDSYLDTSFANIHEAFLQSHKLALMTVYKNDNQRIPSNVLCTSGLVSSYNKEQPSEHMSYVDYGLSLFSPEAFSNYTPGATFDLKDIFDALIKKRELAAYEVADRFYEIGSIAGFKEFENLANL